VTVLTGSFSRMILIWECFRDLTDIGSIFGVVMKVDSFWDGTDRGELVGWY
jgi:hypothetical protein